MRWEWLRRHRLRWLVGATMTIAALALWPVLWPAPDPGAEPWREFVPWCGSNYNPLPIKGEVRERFLLLMSEVFASWDVQHIIRDGRIFTRGEGSLDGKPWPLDDIENNMQPKVASAIAAGVTIDDVFFPPPPALVAEIEATTRYFGPYPRRDAAGERIYGPDPRFEDCDLMRAAILKRPPAVKPRQAVPEPVQPDVGPEGRT